MFALANRPLPATQQLKAAISHRAGIVIVAVNNKLSLFQAPARRVVSLANIISAQNKVTDEASIFLSQEYPCPVRHCKHVITLATSFALHPISLVTGGSYLDIVTLVTSSSLAQSSPACDHEVRQH